MRWEVDAMWAEGQRWRLRDDAGDVVGRVMHFQSGELNAWDYGADVEQGGFANLRDAAVWLLNSLQTRG